MVNVIYEDNHLLVCIKPQNIPSQEDNSGDMDMLNLVKQYIKEKYNKPGNVFVGLVHRLDRPTGGIMVFAKTSKCASRLGKQILNGTFKKQYLTIVNGNLKTKKGKLVNYLAKDNSKNLVRITNQFDKNSKRCELEYEEIASNNLLTLVKIQLKTGRSHQIRVQMSNIDNAVFGDAKYGKGEKYNLALWAYNLKFNHPITNQPMNFTLYPPVEDIPWSYFKKEINNLN